MGSRGLFVGGTARLVTNGASGSSAALIEGGVGLSLAGSGATVSNFGTINGTDGIAVSLCAGDDGVVMKSGSVLQDAVANFQPGDTFDLPFLSFSSSGTVTLGVGAKASPGEARLCKVAGVVDLLRSQRGEWRFRSFRAIPIAPGAATPRRRNTAALPDS